MATGTGGSNAATSLTSANFNGQMADADVATIANLILDDAANVYPDLPIAAIITPTTIRPGSFARTGLLYIPNRGVLKVFPGDRVMVDTVSGWPILVSRTAIGIAGTVWSSTV